MSTEKKPVRGSGLLRQPQQLAERAPTRPDEVVVRPEFVIAFMKRLVRDSSSDAVILAAAGAQKETNASAEEEALLLRALIDEAGTAWPKGFM